MMLRMDFTCPLCDAKTGIQFQKPAHFQPTIILLCCAGCESKIKVRFSRPPGKVESKFHVQVFIMSIDRSGKWLKMVVDRNEAKFKVGW